MGLGLNVKRMLRGVNGEDNKKPVRIVRPKKMRENKRGHKNETKNVG